MTALRNSLLIDISYLEDATTLIRSAFRKGYLMINFEYYYRLILSGCTEKQSATFLLVCYRGGILLIVLQNWK